MKPFSLVAAAIFALIALAHLYRVAVGFPVMIGGTGIGQAVSWAGLAIASVMAVGLFREAKRANVLHHVKLIAELDPAKPNHILVSSKVELPPHKNQQHTFKFTLHDNTNKNVGFKGFASADDCSTCPPDSRKPHTQIPDFKIHNAHHAEFTNLNNNELPKQPQPMDVSYQWEFDCDPGFTVAPFDPIISNGGRV